MSSIISIAASGLNAATQRLQVAANNIANAQSDGPLPTASAAARQQYPAAYTAQQVNQVATDGGGTAAVVTNAQPGTTIAYNSTAPYADQNGLVAAPAVDLASQILQQAIASYEFAANASVIQAYQQTTQALLNIQA